MFMSSATLIGTIVNDPILRNTRDGSDVLNFRVAINQRRRDPVTNTWVDVTTWFVSVACFNSLARNAFETLHKGAPVVVFGTMRTNRWADKDGVEHSRDELRAVSVGPDLVRCTASLARRQHGPVEEERIDADATFARIPDDEAFQRVEEAVPVPA